MAEQWMSIVEYSRTFGISDMTIRRRIRTGRLQAHLRDGKYYIPLDRDPATGEPVKQGSSRPHHAQPTRSVAAQPVTPRSIPTVRPARVETPDYATTERKPSRPDARPAGYVNPWGQIPSHLSTAIAEEREVSVEAQELLNYCNSSLAGIKEIERHVEGRFVAKLETAHEQLKSRDSVIANLNREIEDLQLLVQILEKKRF